MKKLIFTLLINGSFLVVNAQTNAEVIKGETLNCRTNQTDNLNFDETEKIENNKQQNSNKITEANITRKNKKHFIKKVLSNFQGADIKDAWSVVSIN